MPKIKIKNIFSIQFILCLCFIPGIAQQPNALTFPERGFVSSVPATHWENALVSGNGKYGALVYGQPINETIILNHSRLYLPVYEPLTPVKSGEHLTEIRDLNSNGKYHEAALLVDNISKKQGYAEKRWTDPYIPAFNIEITMKNGGVVNNYARSVDFSTGVASVQWSDENGHFQRNLFVSRTDDVVVLSIKGSKSASVNCMLRLAQQPAKDAGGWDPEKMLREGIKSYKTEANGNWLTYRSDFLRQWEGSIKAYEGMSRIVVRGGKSTSMGDSISIENADEVIVLTKIELLYDENKENFAQIKQSLLSIKPDFKYLLSRHAKVHGEVFDRTKIVLGDNSDRRLTSEQLIAKSSIAKLNFALVEKLFDAGRYNIFSSSGELFPNLQGIWSGTYGPLWSGDYTLNGNVQCAISANYSANMAECMLPFFKYLEDHIDQYRVNAKVMFNCRGINVPSRASTHGLKNCFEADRPMTFWTAGAAWVSQFFFDYYQYTGDKVFLKNRALPFMKEAALFYEDFLYEDAQGKYIFSPSLSPENTPTNSNSQACINATMDISVARELLNNCIIASETLKVGSDDISRWKKMLAKMPDYLINEKGAVKEWNTPLLADNDEHRHSSHMYALYNGLPDDIASNPKLKKAFELTMENRLQIRKKEFEAESLKRILRGEKAVIPNYTPAGDNGEVPTEKPSGEMAFGIVQQGFTAASLNRSDVCGLIIDWLTNAYWLPNFISTHNPRAIFNTDISGGFPALVLRMLLDSQPGWISFLPAWPENFPSGRLYGAALRGQIVVNELKWTKNHITVVLQSAINQNVAIRSHKKIISINSKNKNAIVSENGNIYLKLQPNQEIMFEIEYQ
jgi:hypothetical protein